MVSIEDRIRASLEQRARDVEPTPHLWREVDRRIARRRRRTVGVWSLAGAVAAVAALVIVPGIFDQAPQTPDIGSDVEQPPGERPEDTSDDPLDGADPGEDGDPADLPTEGPTLPDPVLVAGQRDIRLLSPDGSESTLATLAVEGESSIMGLAVRPGSTVDDLTAAVLTTAEGMWDLRELRVRGGTASLEVFPEGFRPSGGTELVVTGPVWFEDGATLAWIEASTEGPTLRTIGWTDEGPGTDERATDNASFGLDGAPSGVVLRPSEWVTAGQRSDALVSALTLTADEPEDGWYVVELLRMADGAWGVAAGEVAVEARPGPLVPGTTAALAGTVAGLPSWIVRVTDAGPVAISDPYEGDLRSVALPDGLLPGEGLATLSAEVVGDLLLVSSANTATAVLVRADGGLAVLEGVAWAAVID